MASVRPLEPRQLLSAAATPAHLANPKLAPAVSAQATSGFAPLFNGANLKGWVNPFRWGNAAARKREIQLTSETKFFLVNKTLYRDFILTLDALVPPGGNSGIQIRSRYRTNSVTGLQVDVDNNDGRNWAGWLWNEGGGWVVAPRFRARVRPNQWNHYRIEAIGRHLRVLVNGNVTVNQTGVFAQPGYIALQNHGGSGVYRFRNIRIMSLDP